MIYITFIIGIIWFLILFLKDNTSLAKGLYLNAILLHINMILMLHFNTYLLFKITLIFITYSIICKCYSYIENVDVNDINKDYIYLIFYKPQKISQFLLTMPGLTYSSAGLLVNRNDATYLYQMRYENDTLQKRRLLNKEYLNKYLIIKTDLKTSVLTRKLEYDLLNQKARQAGTLFMRFNCLRCFKELLNQSKIFKYKNEILPCLYLLRLKLTGKIK